MREPTSGELDDLMYVQRRNPLAHMRPDEHRNYHRRLEKRREELRRDGLSLRFPGWDGGLKDPSDPDRLFVVYP